jgi:iron complex transport system substrate-binding protein
MRRLARLGASLAIAMLAFAGTARADGAPRVLSLNLCADQLLLALADPAQIVALSRFARDDGMSAAAHEAQAFPSAAGGIEAILRDKPDLVLAGPYDRPVTSGVLARQGIAVRIVPLWHGLAAGLAESRALAAVLGHSERGEALASRIETAHRKAAAAGQGRSALALGRGGYVDGTDSVTGSLLAAVGLRPAIPATHGRFVPLETLLQRDPQVLVLAECRSAASDRGAALLHHPALRAWAAGRRTIVLPPALTACPGPGRAEALDRLAAGLR